jgi:hypothetical protein
VSRKDYERLGRTSSDPLRGGLMKRETQIENSGEDKNLYFGECLSGEPDELLRQIEGISEIVLAAPLPDLNKILKLISPLESSTRSPNPPKIGLG